nr:hypothetical protein L204_04285 [Cryptococcus depauperatus CBS 7855]
MGHIALSSRSASQLEALHGSSEIGAETVDISEEANLPAGRQRASLLRFRIKLQMAGLADHGHTPRFSDKLEGGEFTRSTIDMERDEIDVEDDPLLPRRGRRTGKQFT